VRKISTADSLCASDHIQLLPCRAFECRNGPAVEAHDAVLSRAAGEHDAANRIPPVICHEVDLNPPVSFGARRCAHRRATAAAHRAATGTVGTCDADGVHHGPCSTAESDDVCSNWAREVERRPSATVPKHLARGAWSEVFKHKCIKERSQQKYSRSVPIQPLSTSSFDSFTRGQMAAERNQKPSRPQNVYEKYEFMVTSQSTTTRWVRLIAKFGCGEIVC
jgi:hypothetical protein